MFLHDQENCLDSQLQGFNFGISEDEVSEEV